MPDFIKHQSFLFHNNDRTLIRMNDPAPTSPDWLTGRIQKSGPIPFRDFMEAALYDPRHGYYTSGRAKIGTQGGDFYTSVSVGPVFASLIAAQTLELWQAMGGPAHFPFIEQGANDGTFAADFLSAAARFPSDFQSALEYTIIEPFPIIRTRQVNQLQDQHPGKVTWLNVLPESHVEGVFFSNELVDALPVHRVVFRDHEWHELFVAADDGELKFLPRHITSPVLKSRLETLGVNFPDGYTTEVHLDARHWIHQIAGLLKRGFILVLDYGFVEEDYYIPDRTDGTLSCYRNHRRSDNPLIDPGHQDITAHVNFSDLAQAAHTQGIDHALLTDQNRFLIGVAQERFAALESAADTPESRAFRKSLHTLTHPGLMGRSFQCLTMSKGIRPLPPLKGYSFTTSCTNLISPAK